MAAAPSPPWVPLFSFFCHCGEGRNNGMTTVVVFIESRPKQSRAKKERLRPLIKLTTANHTVSTRRPKK